MFFPWKYDLFKNEVTPSAFTSHGQQQLHVAVIHLSSLHLLWNGSSSFSRALRCFRVFGDEQSTFKWSKNLSEQALGTLQRVNVIHRALQNS